MDRILLMLISASGVVAVSLGAFGTHGLKNVLEVNGRVETFETAVLYHFIHTIAALGIVILMRRLPEKIMQYSAFFMLGGIVLFSGSLYVLSLSNVTWWAVLTPFGGLAFIIGWILLFIGSFKQHESNKGKINP